MSWRRWNALAAGGGLVLLVVSALIVRDGTVGSAERSVFHLFNDLPQGLYPAMFLFQQAGNLIIAGLVVLGLALLFRSWRIAAVGTATLVAKLIGERVVKAVIERQRPGSSIGPEVILRGRVSAHGLSFVSGHVVLTVGLAMVLGPYLPRRWRFVPWLLAVLNAIARVYVGAHNPLDIVGGVGLGLLIGGVVNLIVPMGPGPRPRPVFGRRSRRPRPAVPTGVVAMALVLLAGACSSEPSSSREDVLGDDAITVASFDFPESEVLAELYSQSLEGAGLTVDRAFGLGSREEVAPALVAGLVEVIPEYAGTALQFHSLGRVAGSADVEATHAALDGVLRDRGLVALAAAPAQDANRFVVTIDTANRARIGALSELVATSRTLRFGGPAECPERPLCLRGLRDVYGLTFESFVRLDAGGALTRQALTDGQVDVALLFSTDPSLTTGEFVELADDRGLQPAENITPVVHREVLDRFGDRAATALDAVSRELTTDDVRAMNAALRVPDATVASVVRTWRASKGLG